MPQAQRGRDTLYKPLVALGNQHGLVSAAGGRICVPAAAALSRAPRAIDLALACDGKRAA
jgi:ribosomal protein S5